MSPHVAIRLRLFERGVSGTGDPYRGNGFAEVLDDAMDKALLRAKSWRMSGRRTSV